VQEEHHVLQAYREVHTQMRGHPGDDSALSLMARPEELRKLADCLAPGGATPAEKGVMVGRWERLVREAGAWDGELRARSHCRFAPPLIQLIPDSLTYSVPLFLKRQCDRTPGELSYWKFAKLYSDDQWEAWFERNLCFSKEHTKFLLEKLAKIHMVMQVPCPIAINRSLSTDTAVAINRSRRARQWIATRAYPLTPRFARLAAARADKLVRGHLERVLQRGRCRQQRRHGQARVLQDHDDHQLRAAGATPSRSCLNTPHNAPYSDCNATIMLL
jgi:hypothetical protein